MKNKFLNFINYIKTEWNCSITKKVLKDKLFLMKILLFDTALKRNWFINLILIIAIIYFIRINPLITGVFISALTSFNKWL